MAENLQFWKENKVIGYMAEASTVYPPGSDLHELKTYVTSRLLWNSSRVPLQEIGEFLVLYYGRNGAASVKLYMDQMIQSVKAIGYCRADDGRSLGPKYSWSAENYGGFGIWTTVRPDRAAPCV